MKHDRDPVCLCSWRARTTVMVVGAGPLLAVLLSMVAVTVPVALKVPVCVGVTDTV